MTGSLKTCTFLPDMCQALSKSSRIIQNGRKIIKLCSVVLTKSVLLMIELKKLYSSEIIASEVFFTQNNAEKLFRGSTARIT